MSTCALCRFYRDKVSSLSAVKYKEGLGECRRNSPRGPIQIAWTRGEDETHIVTMSPFPVVPYDDWCGDFDASEVTS